MGQTLVSESQQPSKAEYNQVCATRLQGWEQADSKRNRVRVNYFTISPCSDVLMNYFSSSSRFSIFSLLLPCSFSFLLSIKFVLNAFFLSLRKLLCWRCWLFTWTGNYPEHCFLKRLSFKPLWTTGLRIGCAGPQHSVQHTERALMMKGTFNGQSQAVWERVLQVLGEEDLRVELLQPNFIVHPSCCYRIKCNHIYHQKPFPLLKTVHQTLIDGAILTQWWKCQQYVSEREPKAWGIVQLMGCCC